MGGLFGGGSQTISTSEKAALGLRVQSSAYGLALPLLYGRNRIPGNLIWYGDFTPVAHTETTSSGGGGGKGGGGGVTSTNTTYTYTVSAAMGLAEGPITAVNAIWRDKDYLNKASDYFTAFLGTYPQSPWAYLTSAHPGQDVGYQGVAYVAAAAYDLGSSDSLPNHTFDVTGRLPFGSGIDDANPKDILVDFMANAHYGAGFPSAKLGDLTAYSNYCVASGLFLSPVYAEQVQASEVVTALMRITNAGIFFSEGLLKVVPYGDASVTANGATFTPNTTPIYALGDDDFIVEGDEDPVRVMRNSTADAFNQVQVEFVNRANQYNVEPAEAKDQVNIDTFGLRPMDPVKAHEIADVAVARKVAQLLMQRSLYVRNTYEFKLGWKYCLLEPCDYVTLTESTLGLAALPVRILSVEENEDGLLTVTAEDAPAGVSSHATYGSQAVGGYTANYNQTPGNVIPPAFYERRVSKQIAVGIAVTGNDALWGGCKVWVSQDNATFKQVAVVSGRARYGSLNSATGATTSDVLDVQLVGLGGKLLSGTAQDADQFVTECYVDGEIVSYETATLTGTNRYTLSALRRGGYGTTAAAHAAGSAFIRVDDAIVESDPLDVSMIGKSLWFKFTSFNVFGGGQQQLADVQAFQYVVKGTPLYAQLANVQNLVDVFRDGRTMLTWDVVLDDRDVDYEIRKGATWATAQALGRTPNTEFVTDGDGTYWVAAHADQAYSATPASITLAGSVLVANVVATYDEEATLWGGSVSGGAMVLGIDIVLAGAGLFSAIPLLSGVSSVFYFGGVSSSGSYTVPAGHEVDVGTSQPCNCSVSYRLRADNPYALFSAAPDVAALASMAGDCSGLADAKVQIAIAPDSGVYGAWRDFVPGKYVGRKFKFQVLLSSSDPSVTAILDTFAFTVDMPDRVERGTGVNCPAGGLTVTYAKPFQVAPNVQITIQGAIQNDDVVLTGQTTTGFTVQVLQGGIGVARTINWLSQGY